ncbi:UNC-50 [Lentinula aciculospora]|uniref:UNC-50 n=1 Tax=Lentinula aciculospora TaxID=153920 RepID=A0A9W8ZUZ3_9AGAR|nr:UNC-50 [Lentinula aciculospora]
MDLPSYSGSQVRSPASMSQRLPLIFRRLHRFNQMDFEQAIWQLGYLCLAPRRVYRNVYFHKQTKNTWARDDPAILVLIAACLFVSAITWSFAYSYTVRQAFKLALFMILRDYLLTGIVVATVLWLVSNRLLVAPPSHSSPADSVVEWAYAFDVHTNAFFPFFLTLYVAQLFVLPVILKDNWVCLFLGNTLYLAGFAQYTYGVYLGLNALPFLIRSELLLSPLLPLFTAYIISLLGFNVAKHVLAVYFGS